MAEEYCWAITQKAERSCLHPIGHQDVGIWISAGLSCIYVRRIVHQMRTHLRLAPNLSERNYCVSAGCLCGYASLIDVLCGDVTHVGPADIYISDLTIHSEK
jgi:hypothetical protein